ncbi:unnamed protein product, partial [Didymodactylos carnosus]
IKFGPHSTTIRLLYSIIFDDKGSASNSTRKLLNEWDIKITSKVPRIKANDQEQQKTEETSPAKILKSPLSSSDYSINCSTTNYQKEKQSTVTDENKSKRKADNIDNVKDVENIDLSGKKMKLDTTTSSATIINSVQKKKTTAKRHGTGISNIFIDSDGEEDQTSTQSKVAERVQQRKRRPVNHR